MNLEDILKDTVINFDGKIAIYYDDLKGHTLEMNEHDLYNGASCIKIFILIELFNQIYKGIKSRNDKLKCEEKHYVNGSGVLQYLSKDVELKVLDVATLMMIISDNVATNMLIDYLGIENINRAIKELGCDDTELYSKFKQGKDEMFSVITAKDYANVWKKINNKELYDANMSEEIIDILKNQKYHEMVADGIDDIYKLTDDSVIKYIATKSGKYKNVRNDGGIVSTIYGNYVLVILINGFRDEFYMNDDYVYSYGKKISNIVFNNFIFERKDD